MAKANLRSMGSLFTGGSFNQNGGTPYKGDIVKEGVLKKVKSMKKRYFVLRQEISENSPARFEYYENKKKFDSGSQPKRKYMVRDCYISRKVDSKNRHVFALFNKDCIAVIAETEEEMLEWMAELNVQKNLCSDTNGSADYQHVWRVEIQNRSLGCNLRLPGVQLVVLTNGALWLVRYDQIIDRKEIVLTAIKRCAHVHQFFMIELGTRSSVGSGMLWMKPEDPLIAENMHNIVGDACSVYSAMTRCLRALAPQGNNVQSDCQDLGAHRLRVNSVAGASQPDFDIRPFDLESNLGARRRTTSDSGLLVQGIRRLTSHSSPLDPMVSSSSEISEMIFTSLDPDSGRLDPEEVSEYICMGGDPTDTSDISHRKRPITAAESIYVPMDGPSLSGSHVSDRPVLTLNGLKTTHYAGSPSSSRENGRKDENPYLEMGQNSSIYSVLTPTSSSIPIPIGASRDSSYVEMSPMSASSSSTSRTTSSDQLHETGSGSTLGSGFSHTDDVVDRPIRTSSVGSKPELYPRKNRNYAEQPCRTRAFTIGSHTPCKTTQNNVTGGKRIPLSDCDLFPSIKEVNSRTKCKSCSTPVLAWSPVSHSWSGTTGSYFRNHLCDESNGMVLDYSTPGSIGEEKAKGFWASIGATRVRSNSKSSGCSNPKSGEFSEACETKAVDIPLKNHKDYCEMDYNHSPHSTNSDPFKGYVPMHGSMFLSTESIERKLSTQSCYLEMSTPTDSSTNADGYVDMTQNGQSMMITPSSKIDVRPSHNTQNQLTLELSSPHADFVPVDATDDKGIRKKGSRKTNKRSFKEGCKSRKSDPGSFLNWPPDGEGMEPTKSKGALSTITSLMTRKSQTPKSPASPQNLLPRTSITRTSPFSSLTRNRNKEAKLQPNADLPVKADTLPRINDSSSKGLEKSHAVHLCEKNEETVQVVPVTSEETNKSSVQEDSRLDKTPLLPSKREVTIVRGPTSVELVTSECRNYVNMSMGVPIPICPPKETVSTDEQISQVSADSKPQPADHPNYMLMDGSDRRMSTCESKASENTKASLQTQTNVTERARSLSGPGASNVRIKQIEKKLSEDGRAVSACSSPVSHSPPMSPTLGSMSSMSSLSEGGMSSASSTSTVINVGLVRSLANQAKPPNESIQKSATLNICNSNEPIKPEEAACKADTGPLNYVSLDLRESTECRSTSRRRSGNVPKQPSYTEIDFVKSEGLRNTALVRDSNRQ